MKLEYDRTKIIVYYSIIYYEIIFQTPQETSQLPQVTTRSIQSEVGNLYTTSPVRRTVYQSVPTGGTEKDIHYTPTQQETACLPQDLTTALVLPDFDVLHLILLNRMAIIADGLLSKLKVGITTLSIINILKIAGFTAIFALLHLRMFSPRLGFARPQLEVY